MMPGLEYGRSITTVAITQETLRFDHTYIKAKRGIVGLVVMTTVNQFQHFQNDMIVRVNEREKVRITGARLNLYYQRFSKRYPAAVFPAAAATTFIIPFYNMDFDEGDPRRYLCQLEPGDVELELDKNATPGAGTIRVGWLTVPDAPTHFFETYQQALNVDASSAKTNADVKAGADVEVKGLIINTTGVTDYEAHAIVGDDARPQYVPLDHAESVGMIGKQVNDDGSVTTNPICWRVDWPTGNIRFYLTTGAGWAGATNQAFFLMRRPARLAA